MTPDVNVLLAASRTDHPHHRRALIWLEGALAACGQGQTMAVLPMVAVGFLRLATQARVFVEPTPLPDALAFLRSILTTPGVEMLPLGPEWPLVEQLCTEHDLTGNGVPDAWIAAAVHANHEHLVTFDRGFVRLLTRRELTVLDPAT